MSSFTTLPSMSSLRAFEAAGRYLNFRAAADELGVTQGAIAQQIRGLETSLDVHLFERKSRGVEFTVLGRIYHQEVSDLLARLYKATALLKPVNSTLTISVTPTFASYWLVFNLPKFSAEYPNVDVRIISTEKVLSFYNENVDLAVRQGKPPFGAQFNVDCLFRQSIIAVAAPKLVASETLPLGSHNLSRFSLLHDTHNLWPQFLKLVCINNKALKLRNFHFSQTDLSINAALSGQGIALVSRFLVARYISAGQLVQVFDNVLQGDNDFYLLSKIESSPQPMVEAARQWLISQSDIGYIATKVPNPP